MMRCFIPPTLLCVLSTLLLIASGWAQTTAPESGFDSLSRRGADNGLLLLRSGNFKAAQVSLGPLCRTQAQDEEVLQALGLAYLRIAPKEAPAKGTPGAEIIRRVGHAACLGAQRKFDEARREYTALTQENPEYPNMHYAFGRFFVEMDDVPSAIEEFKREIRNQPMDVNSRLEIASAEYKLDSAAGLPYAEEVVILNPRIPSAHYLLGLLYLDTDNYQKAIAELEIAQKALPRDARLCFALGSAYARAGRIQDAARARALFQSLSKEASSESETPTVKPD